MRYLLLLGVILMMVGCTLTDPPDSTTSVDLRQRLDEVRQSQVAAIALWDRLIFGDQVSCQESIPTPSPVVLNHPTAQQQAIQNKLNEAIQLLQTSASLWDSECTEPDAIVPLSAARDGRANAVSAGERLDEASDLFD
jgi:hypothetical protein